MEKLQRIASLRQLGLSLEQIRECLAGREYPLERVLELQIRREGPENVTRQHGMQMVPGLWEYMGQARAALQTKG